jgi:hypothetical protein
MKDDVFTIFYDGKLMVVLHQFVTGVYPLAENVLDWYAKNYAFDRKRITGCYSYSISVADVKYEEFV